MFEKRAKQFIFPETREKLGIMIEPYISGVWHILLME
jgi:hypothetical protein